MQQLCPSTSSRLSLGHKYGGVKWPLGSSSCRQLQQHQLVHAQGFGGEASDNRAAPGTRSASQSDPSPWSSLPSIDYVENAGSRQQQVFAQLQRRQQASTSIPASMPEQLGSQDSDLLWAGYSALEEQLHKQHTRHDALLAHVQELQAKLHAAQQQPPASAWQAAMFLLFFMCFINFVGLLLNFQSWLFLPWMTTKSAAAAAAGGGMWAKQLLNFALPATNTLVVLIFCLQAIKAAWTCLKW